MTLCLALCPHAQLTAVQLLVHLLQSIIVWKSQAILGELEDTVHMLVLSTEDKWTVTDKIPFSTMNKKGDLVNVEAKEIPNK